MTQELLRELEEMISESEALNHRRMLVLTGKGKSKLAGMISKHFSQIKGENVEILYSCTPFRESEQSKERFDVFLNSLEEEGNVTLLSFEESEKAMGRTFDLAVLDLTDDFDPDVLGRLIETVRGGGLILMLTPRLENLHKTNFRFHKKMITPPYEMKDIRRLFLRRIASKIMEHDGIWVMDCPNLRWIKRGVYRREGDTKRRELMIPERTVFPREVYDLAITQDQVNAISLAEKLLDEERYMVITADRGRGKSAVLGISLAALAHELSKRLERKREIRVVVTSPEFENVLELMKFASITLERLGVEHEVLERKILSNRIRIVYCSPLTAAESRGDLIGVDEAGGVHVPILHEIMDKYPRAIYSSTLHGYEGAGRGFSVKFLRKLEKRVIKAEMEEPIRYSPGDPIERWLFDALLLDSEPEPLFQEDYERIKRSLLHYEKPDLNSWFSGEKEEELKHFFGIYVLAHYRNRPSDAALLADAPHHEARCLKIKETGKIVGALQICKEGNVPREIAEKMLTRYKPPGNIIPDVMVKYYGMIEFSGLKGLRVVRIASHPDAMRMGIGSRMLSELLKESKEYDWIGVGYGSDIYLVDFWEKNGFIHVHLSPKRNPVSGEYSIISIRPLSNKAKDMVREANRRFRRRLLDYLKVIHRDLDPFVASKLLKSDDKAISSWELNLTEEEKERMNRYVKDYFFNFETIYDVALKLIRMYFLDSNKKRPNISQEEEALLISKGLQNRSWNDAEKASRVEGGKKLMKSIIGEIYEHYFR